MDGASTAIVTLGGSFLQAGLEAGVCFVAGTLVKTKEGSTPIECIQAGMMVFAHNPETGETALKEVVRTFVNETKELVYVKVNGEEIVCTNEHPFYSPVKGWISACKLSAGDILVTLNGEYIVVEQVQHELLESPVTVYNFEVADFHTYYVSDISVLVHNMCDSNSPIEGTTSPKDMKLDNGLYKQIGTNGRMYSFTKFENGNQIFRIDFQGKAHRGILPHIHIYSYYNGLRDGELILDIFGNVIERKGSFK